MGMIDRTEHIIIENDPDTKDNAEMSMKDTGMSRNNAGGGDKAAATAKTIAVTGATSGIGLAAVKALVQNGAYVIGTGRSDERCRAAEQEVRSNCPDAKISYLTADLSSLSEVRRLASDIRKTLAKDGFSQLDVLINNAGLAAGLNPLQEGDIDDWNRMIDTNVKGLLYITRYISPLMVMRGEGHIVNVGSISGKEVYPNGTVYCATKHAVDALTKGMRMDMLKHNIKVTQICPGAVETEFSIVRFRGDKERAAAVYEGYENLVEIGRAHV